MRDNALSVANYFVELAKKDGKEIKLLGLMKRVYIAHGFSLALLNRPIIDPRFDKVEAWKYGPVIPSVYHSFKQYKNNPITQKTDVMEWNEDTHIPTFVTPTLKDEKSRMVVEMVWKRYISYSDNELVTLTHKKGSPWYWAYLEGENNVIPDDLTKIYYTKLVANIMENARNGK